MGYQGACGSRARGLWHVEDIWCCLLAPVAGAGQTSELSVRAHIRLMMSRERGGIERVRQNVCMPGVGCEPNHGCRVCAVDWEPTCRVKI